jgi:hypothetical protein
MYIFVESLVRSVCPPPGVTGIADDLQQPGASAIAAKTIKGFPGSEIRLLDEIVAILIVADDPPRQIISGIQVRQEESFKRLKSCGFL